MPNLVEAASNQILDTTAGDTGATQTITSRKQNIGIDAHIQCEIGSGDTVVIEGRVDDTLSFVVLYTFTADTIISAHLPSEYRARRTVDGGTGDSEVWIKTFGDE